MKSFEPRTTVFQIRIDVKTQRALQEAAAHSGMSASAFALIGIRELLREGETKIILPEYMRLTRTELERRNQEGGVFWRNYWKERRQRQAQERGTKRSNPPQII